MKLFKSVAIRAVALLLFFAMIAAVILYQAGVYDLSFIDRPLPPVTEGSVTTVPSTEGETTNPPVTTLDPFATETLPPIEEDQVEEMLAAIETLEALREAGYEISLQRFDEGDRLARFTGTLGAEGFSFRTETVKKTVLQLQSSGRYTTKTVNVTQDIPTIRLYFGLILVDNGKSYTVYNGNGKEIVKNFVGTLPMARSVNGLPVVMIGSKYYEVDPEKGLGEAIAKEKVDFKALSLDYTASYAAGGSVELYPFSAYVDIFTYVGDKPKPTEPPTETDPDETEPEETEPEETEPEETEPEETEPEETDPEDTSSTEDTTSDDTTSEDSSSEDTTSEEVTTEETTTEKVTTEETTEETTEDTTTEVTTTEETAAEDTTAEETAPESDVEAISPAEVPANAEEDGEMVVVNGTVEIDGKYYKVTQELRWGYRNAKGETVIEPQFKTAYAFTADGLAAVTDFEDNLFFINTAGKEVVTLRNKVYVNPPEYNYVRYRQLYLDALQKDLESIGMYYYDEGYVMVRYCLKGAVYKNYLYKSENHLLDTKGNRFDVPAGYVLEAYSEGVLLLSKNGKYGYMDTDGGWISPAVYTQAGPFQQGLAVAADENGKYGMIDREGNLILPYCFDYISQVSSGVIATYTAEGGWQLYCVVSQA